MNGSGDSAAAGGGKAGTANYYQHLPGPHRVPACCALPRGGCAAGGEGRPDLHGRPSRLPIAPVEHAQPPRAGGSTAVAWLNDTMLYLPLPRCRPCSPIPAGNQHWRRHHPDQHPARANLPGPDRHRYPCARHFTGSPLQDLKPTGTASVRLTRAAADGRDGQTRIHE